MKVLMFGWEFPPHISGGLGTACQGLTESLVKEGVDIVFVVPKMGGDEYAPGMKMVSGADVPIRAKKTLQQNAGMQYVAPIADMVLDEDHLTLHDENIVTIPSPQTAVAPVPSAVETATAPAMIVLKVSSCLTPYVVTTQSLTFSEGPAQWRSSYGLEESFSSPMDTIEEEADDLHVAHRGLMNDMNDPYSRSVDVMTEGDEMEFSTYPFSGVYGADLLHETERYAEVASNIAAQYDHDVIHVHDWMTFPAGLASKSVSGKPLIVHVHSTEFDRSGDHPHPAVFAIEKEGLQGADHIVAVSAWTKQILVSRYGISPAKISVVHNGVVPKERGTALGRRPGSQVVTFLGRLTFQKGPLYFVRAAYKVLEKFPDTRFIVAGSGDLFPAVVEHVAHLRLSSRFYFTGFLKGNDVDKVWSVSDLYVMPSVSEPFGITPLEAVHAGIPVIVSKQSGVSEVMQHAIKVDFWNIDALANAICTVLAYKSLSATLRKNSKHEIKNITWDKPAKKIKNLYHEITR